MLLQTHTYDALLKERKLEIKSHLERVLLIDRQTKLDMFEKLSVLLRTSGGYNNPSELYFNVIVNDYKNNNNAPNYDPSNELFAPDLLYLCGELCFSKDTKVVEDVLELTNIQLSDMATGPCPPGRTTRLIQIVLSFQNFLKSL